MPGRCSSVLPTGGQLAHVRQLPLPDRADLDGLYFERRLGAPDRRPSMSMCLCSGLDFPLRHAAIAEEFAEEAGGVGLCALLCSIEQFSWRAGELGSPDN